MAILAIGIVAFQGCAVLEKGYVNPANGDRRVCRTSGWGWIGTPMAFVIQADCEKWMEGLGYAVESGKK